ncbi:EpsG family protein [Sporolactobacillus terrae]|uniref:EpsG family protein n=1 Tax=Sporolactobacillus terrae TaxID=269673 RepID=UPI001CBD48D2|nr:EpsG family protein [Sporolactobacillus terrae]UAK16378.1 EpsG family protein [Sporolactobacillus terrae]
MFYYLVYGICTFLGFLVDAANKDVKNTGKTKYISEIGFFAISLVLFLLGALRYFVGVDYALYLDRYIPQVLMGIPDAVEPGFKWIILIGSFFGNFQWIYALTQLVIVLLVSYSIKHHSNSIGWSVFFLTFGTYINLAFSIMRQTIATGIFLFSLKYLFDKKPIKFLICIMIAALFHKSALFFLPVIIFMYIPFNRIVFLGIIVGSAILKGSLQSILLSIFEKMGEYEGYITDFNGRTGTSGVLLLEILPVTLLIIYLMFSKNYDKLKNSRRLPVLMYLQSISTSILIFSNVLPQFERTVMMVSFSNIIMLPLLFPMIERKNTRIIVKAIFVAIYLIVFFQTVIVKSGTGSYPFRFIFWPNTFLY